MNTRVPFWKFWDPGSGVVGGFLFCSAVVCAAVGLGFALGHYLAPLI